MKILRHKIINLQTDINTKFSSNRKYKIQNVEIFKFKQLIFFYLVENFKIFNIIYITSRSI